MWRYLCLLGSVVFLCGALYALVRAALVWYALPGPLPSDCRAFSGTCGEVGDIILHTVAGVVFLAVGGLLFLGYWLLLREW